MIGRREKTDFNAGFDCERCKTHHATRNSYGLLDLFLNSVHENSAINKAISKWVRLGVVVDAFRDWKQQVRLAGEAATTNSHSFADLSSHQSAH